MKFIVKLILLVLLCSPTTAFAELSEHISSDFAVIEGYVVMPINDEYIVDLDDRDNLHVGDILTLVKPGKNIFHPVTNEVLGSVDEVIGFLRVTRIHSGYSYAKAISDGLAPDNGAPVKRFEQVPAMFVDTTEGGSEVTAQVKVNLPQFRWLEKNESGQALLTFTLQNDYLDIKNAQGDSLHKYKVTEEQQLVSTAVSAPRPYVTPSSEPKPRLLQQFANSLVGTFSQTNEERFAEMDQAIIRKKQIDRQGIWMSPNIGGHPAGLAVADYDGDGLQETAVVLNDKLLIARIAQGQYSEVAEIALPDQLQIVSIDALDLDADGRFELYFSALAGDRPSSFVVEYDGVGFTIGVKNVRWFLRAVNLPGQEGFALVGQGAGNDQTAFSGDIFHVQRNGKSLIRGDVIELPAVLNLFNFLPFVDDHNRQNFLYMTDGDYLKVISADGEDIWESADYFGGSENCFMHRKEMRDEMLPPTCMRPRLLMTPGNEMLAVQNDGQRMTQRYRKFKKSRVVSLGWNGFTLNEVWRTATQPGYLGDFALADADNDGSPELVMAVKFQHAGLTEDARSSIVIYELE